MTDDIVKELRAYTCDYFSGNPKHLTWEAADRIEALEVEVQRLKDKCDLQAKTIELLRT